MINRDTAAVPLYEKNFLEGGVIHVSEPGLVLMRSSISVSILFWSCFVVMVLDGTVDMIRDLGGVSLQLVSCQDVLMAILSDTHRKCHL